MSPEQREELRELLTEELRTAWRTAVEGGASPAALTHLVQERRQVIGRTELVDADDAQGPVRDAVEDPGVGH